MERPRQPILRPRPALGQQRRQRPLRPNMHQRLEHVVQHHLGNGGSGTRRRIQRRRLQHHAQHQRLAHQSAACQLASRLLAGPLKRLSLHTRLLRNRLCHPTRHTGPTRHHHPAGQPQRSPCKHTALHERTSPSAHRNRKSYPTTPPAAHHAGEYPGTTHRARAL